ncbi:MAG: DUF3145 domain-containing protein [Actinomycetaceae bacterium]|nr:DUF3145 domain-containing protein [Actinomycetaceae bacterium]MDY6083331.1 DUF3145 domain-containing protein [Actinomycetaceae bacterium]
MNTRYRTQGVIFIHSVPPAVQPHVEWAVSSVLGYNIPFLWTPQDAQPGMNRAEATWEGDAGTGAMLASAMRGWEHLRYEITEDATQVTDGGRWLATPDLGIFYAQTDRAGNIVIPENRIRSALERAGEDSDELHRLLDLALGKAWDDELEPFRYSGAGAPVRWIARVG